jgi:hypothetical protein
MAKKSSKTTTAPAAKKSSKPASSKSTGGKPAKKAPKPHADDQCECDEIQLDDTEAKAIDLVVESDKVRIALEQEVNDAVTHAVRKVCKQHGASLTLVQAQNVAMVLFGD